MSAARPFDLRSCDRFATRPGDRSLGRSDRFDLNVFCFINTSVLDVLRRRVEFTQYCSGAFQAALGSYGMRSSMSRTGNC